MRVKEMRADLLGYRAAICVDATQIVQAEQPNTSKAFTKLADRLRPPSTVQGASSTG